MKIGYEDIGQVAVTLEAKETVQAGMAVSLSASGEAEVCPDGKALCGVALHVRDGAAAVQMGGFATVGYTGTAPAAGWNKLAGDGSGKVKVDSANGKEVLVVKVDESDQTVVLYL
jgi:hypothetical protein